MIKRLQAVVVLTLLLMANDGMAQVIFQVVQRQDFTQTQTGVGAASGFDFLAFANGDGSMTSNSPLTAANVVLPSSASHGLTYNSSKTRWEYTKSTTGTWSAFLATYPDQASYNFSLTGNATFGGQTVNVTLGNTAIRVRLQSHMSHRKMQARETKAA